MPGKRIQKKRVKSGIGKSSVAAMKLLRNVVSGIAGAALLAMAANTAMAQLLPPLPILSNQTFPVSVINDSPWFVPMRVSAIMGDTVVWTNRSQGTHTITSHYMVKPHLTEIETALRH